MIILIIKLLPVWYFLFSCLLYQFLLLWYLIVHNRLQCHLVNTKRSSLHDISWTSWTYHLLRLHESKSRGQGIIRLLFISHLVLMLLYNRDQLISIDLRIRIQLNLLFIELLLWQYKLLIGVRISLIL